MMDFNGQNSDSAKTFNWQNKKITFYYAVNENNRNNVLETSGDSFYWFTGLFKKIVFSL